MGIEPAGDEPDGLGGGEMAPESRGGHDEEVGVFGADGRGGDVRFGGDVGGGRDGVGGRGVMEALAGCVLELAGPFAAVVAEGAGGAEAEEAVVLEEVGLVGVGGSEAGDFRGGVGGVGGGEGEGVVLAPGVAAAEHGAGVACAGDF